MDHWPGLDDAQRLAWLRLIRTRGIGPAVFQDLVNLFGGAQNALENLTEFTAKRGRSLRPMSVENAQEELAAAERAHLHFVALGEPSYPRLLAMSDRPPPLLCMRGNKSEVAQRDGVAIVGSRNASAAGMRFSELLAQHLADQELTVVSGLARGIDTAAHNGALKAGTIAFLAGGLPDIYPPQNEALAARIVDEGGALYSEMPLGWKARAQDFPRRNRLVAGAALGLVVVEAGNRSGTLITAQKALDMGRTLMAVPGFPLDPRSAGTNSLLKEGATLVRSADDVMEELAPQLERGRSAETRSSTPNNLKPVDQRGLDEDHSPRYDEIDAQTDHKLTQALSQTPVSADILSSTTGVALPLVRFWLLEMELAGRVMRGAGDLFSWSDPAQLQGP
ncbi:MAG: DNA-processing protein DprA [Pseudomonadota bacterium]